MATIFENVASFSAFLACSCAVTDCCLAISARSDAASAIRRSSAIWLATAWASLAFCSRSCLRRASSSRRVGDVQKVNVLTESSHKMRFMCPESASGCFDVCCRFPGFKLEVIQIQTAALRAQAREYFILQFKNIHKNSSFAVILPRARRNRQEKEGGTYESGRSYGNDA